MIPSSTCAESDNDHRRRTVAAPSPHRRRTVAAPSTAATYTATYQCVAGCSVVRGNLGTLRGTAGDFTAATQACVTNDLPGTTVDDPTPTPAGGTWYLVRTVGCSSAGTYDEDNMAVVAGPRDAEIAASGVACS